MIINKPMTRRQFLKLCGLACTSLAFQKYIDDISVDPGDLARVSTTKVSVYSKPSDKSEIKFQRYRDELIHIYYEVISEDGPSYNPLWYRVWGGFIHSAHLPKVKVQHNPVLSSVREGGQLVEVTVPFSQAMIYNKQSGWAPVYRLYCGSNHWITDVIEGPDGDPWYKILDDLLKIYYYAPAAHYRPYREDELTPISPDIPLEKKRIEISIANQTLKAYENDTIVLDTKISSGIPRSPYSTSSISTETPKGKFNINSKMPSKHMGDGNLTADPEAYELPGVPWVSFFETETGVACHGTYWHNNFGVRMSHGCINMRNEEAQWLYRWTMPIISPTEWHKVGYGTLVIVS